VHRCIGQPQQRTAVENRHCVCCGCGCTTCPNLNLAAPVRIVGGTESWSLGSEEGFRWLVWSSSRASPHADTVRSQWGCWHLLYSSQRATAQHNELMTGGAASSRQKERRSSSGSGVAGQGSASQSCTRPHSHGQQLPPRSTGHQVMM
jgi:hypothetical protein